MKGVIRGSGENTVYLQEGQQVSREEFFAAFPAQKAAAGPVSLLGWKPIFSDARAVHPDQVQEARSRNLRHGVNVDYLPDGRAVLDSRQKRKALLKLEHCHDRSGGYGDG